MDKMISINHEVINRQVSNLENKGIIYCWETYKFRSIKISGNINQCLQYCLNAFFMTLINNSLVSCSLGSISCMSHE